MALVRRYFPIDKTTLSARLFPAALAEVDFAFINHPRIDKRIIETEGGVCHGVQIPASQGVQLFRSF